MTKYADGAFLGSMREVTNIQATRKLLKDQFRFSPEIQVKLRLRAVGRCESAGRVFFSAAEWRACEFRRIEISIEPGENKIVSERMSEKIPTAARCSLRRGISVGLMRCEERRKEKRAEKAGTQGTEGKMRLESNAHYGGRTMSYCKYMKADYDYQRYISAFAGHEKKECE